MKINRGAVWASNKDPKQTYTVLMLTNTEGDREVDNDFPPSVTYRADYDGRVWSCTLERFTSKKHHVRDMEACEVIRPDSPQEWDLETRAFGRVTSLPESDPSYDLIRDLWRAFVGREAMIATLPNGVQAEQQADLSWLITTEDGREHELWEDGTIADEVLAHLLQQMRDADQ